ncbi:MAG: hypothetical protein ACTSSP_02805 [Candidatus Asgardarchaeia archaeon]
MRKGMLLITFLCVLLFFVPVMAQEVPEPEPSIPVVPVIPSSFFNFDTLSIVPNIPTIPNIDLMHTPKVRNNVFGIDLGQYLGDSEVTARTVFKSKHKWYGQDWFDDKGAVGYGVNYRIPKITELPGQLYLDIMNWSPMGTKREGSEKAKQNNYKVYYVQNIFEGEKHQVQLSISEIYYDLTNAEDGDDGQEFGVGLAFPNLFVFEGKGTLVPSFYVGKVWNLKLDDQGNNVNEYDGTVFTGGLDYYRPLTEKLLTDIYLRLNYSEGFESSENKFTDVTVGVLFDMELASGIIVTPSVNYIYYLDDTLAGDGNSDAEVWTGITIRYNF